MVQCSTCSSATVCLTCFDNQQSIYNNVTFKCDPCYIFIPNCLTCTLNKRCLSCLNTFYALSLANTCELCNRFMQGCRTCSSRLACTRCLSGRLVIDQTGCSNIVGCINVNPLASISNNCKRCDPFNFFPLPLEDGPSQSVSYSLQKESKLIRLDRGWPKI